MYNFLVQKFLCWQCPPPPINVKMSTTKLIDRVNGHFQCKSDNRLQQFFYINILHLNFAAYIFVDRN